MVKIKNRYIAIRINSLEKDPKLKQIQNIIYTNLKECFGDIIMSKIEYLEICEIYEQHRKIILKCNLAIYKHICFVISTIGKAMDLNIRLETIFVSGILKKVKSALLRKFKEEAKVM